MSIKHLVFSTAIFVIGWQGSASAQQKTAVRHSDGSVTVETMATVEAVKAAAVAVTSSTTKRFVSHEAVKLADGTQEIRLTDNSGKVTVISATAGESVQQKYRDYLQKEGMPCACSASDAEVTSVVSTRKTESTQTNTK